MPLVNGRHYDWGSMKLVLPSGSIVVSLQDINFKGELEKESTYGKGQIPIGSGQGNYSSDGDFSVLRDDFEDILALGVATGRGLLKTPPFPLLLEYGNEDQETKQTVLPAVDITSVDESASQGDKNLKVKIGFKNHKPIIRNGVPDIVELI